MSGNFRLTAVASTDVGCVRAENEDSFCARDDDGLWCVADGMGGHSNGKWASQVIADQLAGVEPGDGFEESWQAASQAIHAANARIWEEASERGVQMGSTVVTLCVRDGNYLVLWVGDSRAYLLRNGALHPLTTDHSQVQEMVESGMITAEAAERHPMRHVLSRAVGVEGEIEIETRAGKIVAGDRFLLCSDGLTGVLSEPEIEELADRAAEADALAAMMGLALARGAPDNVTILLVSAGEVTQLLQMPR